jgi:NADPH-dependent F420 reductase
MSETVTILGGTGQLGYGLALRLAHAGMAVTIGSRDAERAEAAAARASAALPEGVFGGAANADAAAAADRVVVVAVPFASQAETIKAVTPSLREGQILLDASVPLAPAVGGRATHLLGVWHGSAAEQARALAPAHIGVVSGLHTLSASVLENLEAVLDQDTLICGDSKQEKAVVTEILSRIDGLRVIDGGRLEASRLVEALTPLLIGINIRNKVHAGVRITGLG